MKMLLGIGNKINQVPFKKFPILETFHKNKIQIQKVKDQMMRLLSEEPEHFKTYTTGVMWHSLNLKMLTQL